MEATQRIESEWDGKPIPMARWGKDHWTTLAYIETRCVDHKGKPHAPHMRSEPGRPIRGHFRNDTEGNEMFAPQENSGKRYATRLNDGHDIFGHDDWSCAADMEVAGLLLWEGTGMYPIFKLTPLGYKIAGLLRQHMAENKPSARFMPPADVMAEVEAFGPQPTLAAAAAAAGAECTDPEPKAGDTVEVVHERKGKFQMRITWMDAEWMNGVIVSGKANAILPENVREEGEPIGVRRSLCSHVRRIA